MGCKGILITQDSKKSSIVLCTFLIINFLVKVCR